MVKEALSLTEFKAANVMCVKAIKLELDPKKGAFVIAGNNGEGKSSILTAIEMLLGGMSRAPAEPIRRGESRAEIIATIGKYTVKRVITHKTSSLQITTADGIKQKPQEILDGFMGALGGVKGIGLDPLALQRLSDRDQVKAIQELVGVSVDAENIKGAELVAERTAVNKDIRARKFKLEEMTTFHHEAPAEEQSSAELLKELEQAEATNRENAETMGSMDQARKLAKERQDQMAKAKAEIAELLSKADKVKEDYQIFESEQAEWTETANRLREQLNDLHDVNTEAIRERIGTVDEVNRRVRANQEQAKAAASPEEVKEVYRKLGEAATALDAAKAEKLSAAEFPVDGLSIGDVHLTYIGIPLSQASSAEQMRVFTGMVLASNPRLPLILIRDGSLLDEANLEVLAQMARDHKGMAIIERVGDEGSVVIEDGMVKGEAEPVAADESGA